MLSECNLNSGLRCWVMDPYCPTGNMLLPLPCYPGNVFFWRFSRHNFPQGPFWHNLLQENFYCRHGPRAIVLPMRPLGIKVWLTNLVEGYQPYLAGATRHFQDCGVIERRNAVLWGTMFCYQIFHKSTFTVDFVLLSLPKVGWRLLCFRTMAI